MGNMCSSSLRINTNVEVLRMPISFDLTVPNEEQAHALDNLLRVSKYTIPELLIHPLQTYLVFEMKLETHNTSLVNEILDIWNRDILPVSQIHSRAVVFRALIECFSDLQ